MLELPRMKIIDRAAFPSQRDYDEFDTGTIALAPLILKRGKVRYRLGEVRRAYRAMDGIYADILLLGNFKGELAPKKDDEFEVRSVVFIPE